ncbi:MAG: membrane protein insertion efficiency factor YidD [Candidatus Rokuibacteriota bacterium]|nr:MAG: membrane protein insertion efficiency factor YidD [Candidatus Rokubacteria bacterium]
MILLVEGYQCLVRPLLPPACRFEPSCSEYYRQSLMSTGLLRATLWAILRISRCHPWHEGGYDPPPGQEARRQA